MPHFQQGRFRQHFHFFRRQFLQEGHCPLTNVLSTEIVRQAHETIGDGWKDRIFSPIMTLCVFLCQVLSADHSCRSAVARLNAHRVSHGQPPCSANTGAYCQARKRLPEKFFSLIACLVGRALDAQVDRRWLWNGRGVYMFDGTTVTMPDTLENQAAYPQVYNQKPGLGFAIARVGALISHITTKSSRKVQAAADQAASVRSRITSRIPAAWRDLADRLNTLLTTMPARLGIQDLPRSSSKETGRHATEAPVVDSASKE